MSSERVNAGIQVYEGRLDGKGMRIALTCSRFNEAVTERLVGGALDALRRHGVDDDHVEVAWTPGAFELPLVAARLAATHRYQAIVALGAVIRGATGHYDFVAGQCATGLARVAADTGVPVIFGVLTTDTVEQALERAGLKAGNKGFEAAVSAIETADLLRRLPGREPSVPR